MCNIFECKCTLSSWKFLTVGNLGQPPKLNSWASMDGRDDEKRINDMAGITTQIAILLEPNVNDMLSLTIKHVFM